MKEQLLHAPIGGFRGVDLVFRRTRQGMGAGELLEIAPRLADDAQHLAVERNLEDAPGKSGFADEHHLVLSRRYADRIRGSDNLGKYTQQDEESAKARFVDAEAIDAKHNILTGNWSVARTLYRWA